MTAFNVKTGAMAWRTKLDSAPLRDTDGMFRLMVRDAVLLAAGSVHGVKSWAATGPTSS